MYYGMSLSIPNLAAQIQAGLNQSFKRKAVIFLVFLKCLYILETLTCFEFNLKQYFTKTPTPTPHPTPRSNYKTRNDTCLKLLEDKISLASCLLLDLWLLNSLGTNER